MARLAHAALALVLLAGCVRSSRRVSADGHSLEQLRARVEQCSAEAQALLKEQDELVWKSWTTGAPVDMARTYGGHEKLFTPENIAAIREVRDAAQAEGNAQERRALTHLLVHF